MALNNYSDLKAAILSRMARTDVTDAMLSDYVALAEGEFNLSLKKMRRMHKKSTVTATVGTSEITLPADYQSLSILRHTNPNLGLSRAALLDLNTNEVGVPSRYDVADKIYFAPTSDATYTLDIFYYQVIPPLAANDTNWLLTNYPQVYLDACLYIGFTDRRNSEAAATYLQKSADNISRLLSSDAEEISGSGAYTMKAASRP